MHSKITFPGSGKFHGSNVLQIIHARGLALGLMAALMFSSCSKAPVNSSDIKVTDVKHTSIKRQSIGNCWLYATATWLESMIKTHTNQEVNISESYWTWWHWYHQLTRPEFNGDEVKTGGSWHISAEIIQNHGWVLADEFITEDGSMEMSIRQEDALNAINEELDPGGSLDTAEKRTPSQVRAELDKAFGSNMAQAEALQRSAATTMVDKDQKGEVSLLDALSGPDGRRWEPVRFPQEESERKLLLVRAFRALNDYKPVVMSVDVDFNAIDKSDNGSFKKSILDAVNKPGGQGGHMVVLKDYTVTHVPGYGSLGAGDLPPEQKAAALQGDLASLIAKNSWGKNRTDRGMVDGYTTFYRDYLYGPIAWLTDGDDESSPVFPIVPLESFVLPPNY